MTIKNITSGTGFGSMIPYNNAGVGTDPQGSVDNDGYGTLPVARWTSIPHRIFRSNTDDGSSTTVGIMAFHASGIKEVDFILNGGTTVTVSDVEYNSTTGFNEYCVKMDRDSVITNMGETSDNAELRAIIRPNHGTPKIMQHDVAGGISGDYALQQFFGMKGISGAYAQFEPNVDESILLSSIETGRDSNATSHPGEASFFLSLYKDVNDATSERTPIEIFLSPSGSDFNDGLSVSTPVKNFKQAFILARRKIGDIRGISVTDFATGPDGFTEGGAWSGFLSHDEIIFTLLPGTYTEDNWYWEYTTTEIGSLSFNKYQLGVNGGFLLVRGQPGEDKSEIIIKSKNYDVNYIDSVSEEPFCFNMARGGLFHCLELRNLTFDRANPDPSKCDVLFASGIGHLTTVQGHPKMRGIVLHNNIHIKTKSPLRDYFGSQGHGTINRRGVSFKEIGVVALNCLVEGGLSQTKMHRYHINTQTKLHGGDQFAYSPLVIGCHCSIIPDAILPLRKIDFDASLNNTADISDEEKDYYNTEYSGWYAPVRAGAYQSLRNAWDSGRDMGGFTLEIPKYRGKELGTPEIVWRKINKEAMVGDIPDIPELYDPVAYVDPTIGDPYGGLGSAHPGTDNFFDFEPTNPDPRIEIFGEGTLGFSYATVTDLRNKKVPEFSGEFFPDVYFENKYMILLDHVTGGGTRSSGYVLADFDKPLVYGTESNQQRFLFRYSGTSAESFSRFGSTGDLTSTFTPKKHGWSRGFIAEDPPQFGGSRPLYNFDDQPNRNDNYPIVGEFTYGSLDSDHADFVQSTIDSRSANTGYTIGDPIEKLTSLAENNIYAYNKIDGMKGQFGNWDITAKVTNETGETRFIRTGEPYYANLPIQDIAMVNNALLGDATEDNNTQWKMSGHETALSMKNFIMEHNTVVGANIVFEYGTLAFTGGAGVDGTTNIDVVGGESLGRGVTYSRDPYGNFYDQTNSDWYIRNNYFEGINGYVFGNVPSVSGAAEQRNYSPQGWTTGSSGSSFTKAIVSERNTIYEHRGFEEGLGSLSDSVYDPYTTSGLTGFIKLEVDERPLFRNALNNASIPYQSALTGLGTGGSQIYDDLNRTKRRNRPTVGAYEFEEPDSSQVNDQEGAIWTYTTSGDLTKNLVTDLNLSPEELEGKRIFVQASFDGEVSNSTNKRVIEPSHATRLPTDDIPQSEAPDVDDGDFASYLFRPGASDETNGIYDVPVDSDNNELPNNDWIPSRYSTFDRMRVYGPTYTSVNYRNRFFFTFDKDVAHDLGGTHANQLQTAINGLAAGDELKVTFPSDNLTLGVSAGTVVVGQFTETYGKKLSRSYHLCDLTTGLTVDLPENVTGYATIPIPSGWPTS